MHQLQAKSRTPQCPIAPSLAPHCRSHSTPQCCQAPCCSYYWPTPHCPMLAGCEDDTASIPLVHPNTVCSYRDQWPSKPEPLRACTWVSHVSAGCAPWLLLYPEVFLLDQALGTICSLGLDTPEQTSCGESRSQRSHGTGCLTAQAHLSLGSLACVRLFEQTDFGT